MIVSSPKYWYCELVINKKYIYLFYLFVFIMFLTNIRLDWLTLLSGKLKVRYPQCDYRDDRSIIINSLILGFLASEFSDKNCRKSEKNYSLKNSRSQIKHIICMHRLLLSVKFYPSSLIHDLIFREHTKYWTNFLI